MGVIMKDYYKNYYKGYSLEQLETEYAKLTERCDAVKKDYLANIAKSGKTEEETKALNREEKDLVSDGAHLEKQRAIVAELIEEAKAKLQMQ